MFIAQPAVKDALANRGHISDGADDLSPPLGDLTHVFTEANIVTGFVLTTADRAARRPEQGY